jgi:hypothetical protein
MATDPQTDPLQDALVRVRSLLIDLERHVDRGAADRDLSEVGRAWVRAAQVERLLRAVLPADVAASVPDVGDQEPDTAAHPDHSHGRRATNAPPTR